MTPRDEPRRIGDLITRLGTVASHLADVLAQWWLGFRSDDITYADVPDDAIPDDPRELTDPDDYPDDDQ